MNTPAETEAFLSEARTLIGNPDPNPVVTVLEERTQGSILIRELEFSVPGVQKPVRATHIRPVSVALVGPGILWGHWLGEKACDRTQFLDEALGMAGSGCSSLLVETQWSEPSWYPDRVLEQDFSRGCDQIRSFRQGLSVLRTLEGVDPNRLVYVGHDYSAMYGTPALALEPDLKAVVLIAFTASFYDWAFYMKFPSNIHDYQYLNDQIEPSLFLPHLSMPVLLQFAEKDFYVNPSRRRLIRDLFGSVPDFRVYAEASVGATSGQQEHAMDAPIIRKERQDWLAQRLGLN